MPNLKIFRDNHVVQEFNKSYHTRKSKRAPPAATSGGGAGGKLTSAASSNAMRNNKIATSTDRPTSNESMVRDLTIEQRVNSEINMHSSNVLRNSFIIEEDEEAQAEEEEDIGGEEEDAITNANTMSNSNNRASGQTITETRSRGQSPAKKLADSVHSAGAAAANVASPAAGDMLDKAFELPFSELVYINLADNQVGLTRLFFFFYCCFLYPHVSVVLRKDEAFNSLTNGSVKEQPFSKRLDLKKLLNFCPK